MLHFLRRREPESTVFRTTETQKNAENVPETSLGGQQEGQRGNQQGQSHGRDPGPQAQAAPSGQILFRFWLIKPFIHGFLYILLAWGHLFHDFIHSGNPFVL